MNLYNQLKIKLEAWTGLTAHPLRKPEDANLPCIVFRGVGTRNYLTQTGNTDLVTERVMITILVPKVNNAFNSLRTYVNNLESNLIGNSTDFVSAIPVNNTKIEDVDEDGINFYMREFFITYNT